MLNKVICGIAVAMLAPSSAIAGGYAGGGLAMNKAKDWNASIIDDGSFTSSNADDSDTGFRVFGGLDVSPNLGLELGYQDMGEATINATSDGSGFWNAGPVNASMELDGFDLSALGKLEINPSTALFGHVGVYFWDLEASISNGGASATGTDDGNDVFFGAGAEFNRTGSVRIRGEYLRYKLDDDKVDSLAVSFSWAPAS